jgi:hypothetical protein
MGLGGFPMKTPVTLGLKGKKYTEHRFLFTIFGDFCGVDEWREISTGEVCDPLYLAPYQKRP